LKQNNPNQTSTTSSTTTVPIETTAVPTTSTRKTTTTIKTTPVPIKTTSVPIKTTAVPIETTTIQKTTTIRLIPKFKNFKDKFGNVKPKTHQGIFENKKFSITTTSTTSLPKISQNRFNFKLRKNQGSTGYFY
jgi:hypothetical protein